MRSILFCMLVLIAGPAAAHTGDIPARAMSHADNLAIMVPPGSKARDAAGLANAEICVKAGSAAQYHLRAYFSAHKIALREFVFQETGEMHDAYRDGRCDAITARKSVLRGLRASMGRDDRILPDNLGGHFIRAAALAAPTTKESTHGI
jgi:ABC-type amino acid transport substrate-binding protein